MSGKTRFPKGGLSRRRGRQRSRPLALSPATRVAAQRLAATLAGLGLFGVAAWADEPVSPPASPVPPAAVPGAPGQAAPAAENTAPKPARDGAPDPDALNDPSAPAPVTKSSTTATTALISPGALAASALPPPPVNNGGTANGSSILGSWGRNLTISGGWTTSYRAQNVSGGAQGVQSYETENYDVYDARPLGPFQQRMDLTIQGKVLNLWNVNARLSNSRYGNYNNQTFGFNYKARGTSIDIGDINAQLSGNELVTFSRNLQGLMFGRDFGGGKIRMSSIVSLTKAATQRGSFRGERKSGPYYLGAVGMIEGTERLRLDGQSLERDKDYTIDYYQGTVYFTGGRIIGEESTVEYTYESQSYNSTPGLLAGTRWDLNTGSGKFGVTYLQQKALGGNSAPREITERQPVLLEPTYHYTLRSRIETGSPVEVWWRDELLIENVDYTLNRTQGFFILLRPRPADTSFDAIPSLRIKYRPIRTSAVGGDRSVMGLDGQVRMGQTGALGFQFGQSQGGASQSGRAMTLTASLRSSGAGDRNKWNLTTTWRDIDAGFSTIDSVSGAFLRAEKGLSANLTYALNQFVNVATNFSQSRIAQQNYSYLTGLTDADTLPTLSWADNRTWTSSVALTYPHLPSLTLNHTQIEQNGFSRSTFTQDALRMAWQRGILSLSADLDRTTSQGQSVFGLYNNGTQSGTVIGDVNTGTLRTDSSSTNSRFSIGLTPASWISLTGSLGVSKTQYGSSASSSDGQARDMSLGLLLNPMSSLSIRATLADTSNGQSTSAFYSGFANAAGTTSNGSFLPGVLSGQRTRTQGLSIDYRPWNNLSLNFNTNRQLALIPGYDNTESATSQFALTYTPMAKLSLNGSLADQKVTYVGNQGNSSNRSYNLTAAAGPFGRLTITSSLQRMNTGSALYYGTLNTGTGTGIPGTGIPGTGIGTGIGSGYGTGYNTGVYPSAFAQRQNLTIWSTQLDYPIANGRTLFFRWQSLDTQSPLGSTQDTLAGTSYRIANNTRRSMGTVGLDVRLTSLFGLTLQANLIRLTDRDDAKYSYQARTMNMDLTAHF